MSAAGQPRRARFSVRAITWSAVLAGVLLLCAGAGRFHRELRGIAIGLRMAASGDEAPGMDLWKLERSAVPGCRLAYCLSRRAAVRRMAAFSMGMSGAASELAELAAREGPGSDAEKGLLELVEFHAELPEPMAPPGVEVLTEDPEPPADELRERDSSGHEKIALEYYMGQYAVTVRSAWSRAWHVSGGPNAVAREWFEPWRRVGASWKVVRHAPPDQRGAPGRSEVLAEGSRYHHSL